MQLPSRFTPKGQMPLYCPAAMKQGYLPKNKLDILIHLLNRISRIQIAYHEIKNYAAFFTAR